MKDQQPPTQPPNDPPPPDDPVELPGDAFFDAGFDTRFEALMRDAARTYNRPPALPDAEALWAAIDRALPAAGEQPADFDVAHLVTHGTPALGERPALAVLRDDEVPAAATPRAPRPASVWKSPLWKSPLWKSPWLRTAAVLLLGVAIGRATVRRDGRAGGLALPTPGASTMTAARATAGAPLGTEAVYSSLPDGITTEYLGRAEALLAALPDELRARRTDPAYLSRADALLLQTRLLLDSPAAADPALRSLFDDLEVVFAQVVRLHADGDPTRIDFLNQALEQRDVLPRLRDAVADNAVADNAAN